MIALTLDVFPSQLRAAADAIDEVLVARESGHGLGPDDVVRIAERSAATDFELPKIWSSMVHYFRVAAFSGIAKELVRLSQRKRITFAYQVRQ